MITEVIASAKPVTTKTGDMIMITTVSNNVVWVPKSQYDAASETVSYEFRKAGHEYTKKDGSKGVTVSNRNEYLGSGKQIVKKHDTLSIMDYLISKGVTPTFSLAN